MSTTKSVSKPTRNNWLLDATLFISAIIAMLSGIYFLYFPIGGYQGGRNPAYDLVLLFTRHTWDDLHTWSGVAMIMVVIIHLSLHWHWVVNMTRRMLKEIFTRSKTLNPRGRFNLGINIAIGFSFLVTALSGIYFLFVPGSHSAADPMFLFSRQTWDSLHTWGGVVLILAAVIHFAIHWNWVVKVTRGVFLIFYRSPKQVASEHPAAPVA
jgi:hypothetical protein